MTSRMATNIWWYGIGNLLILTGPEEESSTRSTMHCMSDAGNEFFPVLPCSSSDTYAGESPLTHMQRILGYPSLNSLCAVEVH